MELLGHRTRHYVWLTPNTAHQHKHTILTVKHDAATTMLWRSFSTAGPGRPVTAEGKMNAAKYEVILEDNLIQSGRERQFGRRFVFPVRQPEPYGEIYTEIS